MIDRPPIPGLVLESKVIAIGRNVPAADVPRIGEALVAGGVNVIELIRWCASRGVLCFPGALPPTETHLAWSAGASAVKLFPAAAVGVGYLRQIAGPFPDIPLVPTGGVSAQTAGDWLAAGGVAVGMGGWLIGEGDPAGVTQRARQVAEAVSGASGRAGA